MSRDKEKVEQLCHATSMQESPIARDQNGSGRRLEQVYATRTRTGLPLLADAICWAVRERVAVQIKAEFPVLV